MRLERLSNLIAGSGVAALLAAIVEVIGAPQAARVALGIPLVFVLPRIRGCVRRSSWTGTLPGRTHVGQPGRQRSYQCVCLSIACRYTNTSL